MENPFGQPRQAEEPAPLAGRPHAEERMIRDAQTDKDRLDLLRKTSFAGEEFAKSFAPHALALLRDIRSGAMKDASKETEEECILLALKGEGMTRDSLMALSIEDILTTEKNPPTVRASMALLDRLTALTPEEKRLLYEGVIIPKMDAGTEEQYKKLAMLLSLFAPQEPYTKIILADLKSRTPKTPDELLMEIQTCHKPDENGRAWYAMYDPKRPALTQNEKECLIKIVDTMPDGAKQRALRILEFARSAEFEGKDRTALAEVLLRLLDKHPNVSVRAKALLALQKAVPEKVPREYKGLDWEQGFKKILENATDKGDQDLIINLPGGNGDVLPVGVAKRSMPDPNKEFFAKLRGKMNGKPEARRQQIEKELQELEEAILMAAAASSKDPIATARRIREILAEQYGNKESLEGFNRAGKTQKTKTREAFAKAFGDEADGIMTSLEEKKADFRKLSDLGLLSMLLDISPADADAAVHILESDKSQLEKREALMKLTERAMGKIRW